jgi:hypothetical protein
MMLFAIGEMFGVAPVAAERADLEHWRCDEFISAIQMTFLDAARVKSL